MVINGTYASRLAFLAACHEADEARASFEYEEEFDLSPKDLNEMAGELYAMVWEETYEEVLENLLDTIDAADGDTEVLKLEGGPIKIRGLR